MLLAAGLYVLGLIWGQTRLPVAAIKNLADSPLLRQYGKMSLPPGALEMPRHQAWYARRSLDLVDGTGPPTVSASVKWNWGIAARVNVGLYFSPTGAERLDCEYVCVFGWWVPVYAFSHLMA